MTKRAILYARVSSEEQADKGYSLPTQLDACRRYAERLGISVAAELTEDHSGATAIAERPTGKRLVSMLKRGEANTLIAYQVDRLSRDIVDLLASVRDWIRAGVEIHACDIGRIESELDIVLVIKGWQGSDERRKIIERTSRGRTGKAIAGKVVGQGKPPYGLAFKDGSFVVVDAEAKVVRLIYRWYVLGDEHGKVLSEWAIARKLSEMGLASPDASRKRTRKVHMWCSATVHIILTNETYVGVWRYGKRIGNEGRRGKRPIAEQIPVSVPVLIERELWDAAQARREYNKHMSKRNCKREYLLRGMGRCGECNYALGGEYSKGYTYYRCSRHASHFAGLEERCSQKAVRADKLEAITWGYVLDLWSNKEKFERKLREAQESERATLHPKQEQLNVILEMIAEDKIKMDNYAELLEEAKRAKNTLAQETYQAKIDELGQRHAKLIERRDELQVAVNSSTLTDEGIAIALQYRDDVTTGMRNATFEDKRRTMELLRVSVIVKDGQARVCCRVPLSERVFALSISCSDSCLSAPLARQFQHSALGPLRQKCASHRCHTRSQIVHAQESVGYRECPQRRAGCLIAPLALSDALLQSRAPTNPRPPLRSRAASSR